MPETLPAGEKLPEYDESTADQPVDPAKLYQWCVRHAGWPATGIIGHNMVSDVLEALQAVGDATLVKNSTYRMLRRDAADIERLAAGLTKLGYVAEIVEHHGNSVDTALTIARLADALGEPTTTEAP